MRATSLYRRGTWLVLRLGFYSNDMEFIIFNTGYFLSVHAPRTYIPAPPDSYQKRQTKKRGKTRLSLGFLGPCKY